MPLLGLPVELILNIADQIDQESDILGPLKCCAPLRNILIPYLYRRNAVSGGGSALPWCSEHGYEQNVERMLQLNVDPETPRIIRLSGNLQDDTSFPGINSPFYRAYNSPSYLAAQRGHEGIVKLLLEYNVDLRFPFLAAVSEGSYNPLHVNLPTRKIFQRVPESYERIVRLLLEHGANPNSIAAHTKLTALTFAIRSKNLGIVSLLLEYGATLDYPGDRRQRGHSWMPHTWEFFYAIDESLQEHDLSIAEPLLELLARHGADMNSPYYHGGSPIHFACKQDPTGRLVRQMIRHGADVNSQKHETRCTPLHLCTEAAALALL
jgi:ankyrin repeat protein